MFKIIKELKNKVLFCSIIVLCFLFLHNLIRNLSLDVNSFENKKISTEKSQLFFHDFFMIDTDSRGNRVAKIQADELTILPKKYYVFNIKPFTELILKNVKINTYQIKNENSIEGIEYRQNSKKFAFPKIEIPQNIFDRSNTTMVSGIRFNGFVWQINKEGKVFFGCQAKNGYLEVNKSEIELQELEFENFEYRKSLSSKKGTIDLKSNLIRIPTSSIRHVDGIPIEGKVLNLDMDMNIIPFR